MLQGFVPAAKTRLFKLKMRQSYVLVEERVEDGSNANFTQCRNTRHELLSFKRKRKQSTCGFLVEISFGFKSKSINRTIVSLENNHVLT